MDEKKGHEILSNSCRTELDSIKRKGVHDTQFSDTERYALQHGVQHMIEVDSADEKSSPFNVEELVTMYVTDVELIYAKLCVNSTTSTEDLLVVQKHVKSTFLDEKSHSLIMSLSSLLRKHCFVLRDHPHLFFQCLVNEGDPELSCRAATIVENDLLNVPYMKYLIGKSKREQLKPDFTVHILWHVSMFHLKWTTWCASAEMKESICGLLRLATWNGFVPHRLIECMKVYILMVGSC